MRFILCVFCLVLLSCHHEPELKRQDFVDMLGRRVPLKTPVRSVVTAGAIPAINSILVLLGKQGIIQNGIPRQLHSARWSMLRKVSPGLAERPVVSTMGPEWTPDYEALSRLSYDAVVLDSLATATTMQQRGITAVTVKWSGADSVKDVVRSLGELTGTLDRATAYASYYDSLLQRVKGRLKSTTVRPSALYVRFDNFTMPIVHNSRDIVELGGGRYAIEASQFPDHSTFSHEQLIAWDPEFLFAWSPQEREKILGDPRLTDLRAVKSHHVYALPMGTHLWFHYSPEIPLGVLWAAYVLHPDLFSRKEIEQELVSFYSKFYSYPLRADEVTSVLEGQP